MILSVVRASCCRISPGITACRIHASSGSICVREEEGRWRRSWWRQCLHAGMLASVHAVAAAYATGPGSALSVISAVISAVGHCTTGTSGLPHSTQCWRSMQGGGAR